MIHFQELNHDQRREFINTRQRYDAYLEAKNLVRSYRGSMVFSSTKGTEYLLRSYYDPRTGVRRQKSLGKRSPETERIKSAFEVGRAEAEDRFAHLEAAIRRQAGINRALQLGRVPHIGARIIRALDTAGLIGHGLRVVGTNAIYAYEAAAGVFLSADVTTTDDIDILLDARASMKFVAAEDIGERTLLGILQRVDRSFARTRRSYQAANRDGYLVDLVRPERKAPWLPERESVSGNPDDLQAVQIAGLTWHESSPAFTAVAIDARGFPTRIVAPDPRAFVVHKLWLSQRPDRNQTQRARDTVQAEVVAALVAQHLPHLPFDQSSMKHFPRKMVEAAAPLFKSDSNDSAYLGW